MFNKILILGKEYLRENEIEKIINFLDNNKFYKTLSLAVALKVGIRIPTTILLLERNKETFEKIYNILDLPLMIRVEYKSLPNKKVLGGIPLYSKETIENISYFLFEKGYFPIFHPNIERSQDLYSIGILIEPNKNIVIETVGRGFDASDLRLGQVFPHEQFKINTLNFEVKDKNIISSQNYMQERKKRVMKIEKINKYIKYVNKKNKLLNSIDNLSGQGVGSYFVPEKYYPMSFFIEKELIKLCKIIHTRLINMLPSSKSFVASLSYIKDIGWILWGIYGGWYYR